MCESKKCDCSSPCAVCECEVEESVCCTSCGCDLDPDDAVVRGDEPYCSDCDPKIPCEECDDLIDKDDSIIVDGEAYCEDCVTKCDECGDYHRSKRSVSVRESDRNHWMDLCPSCAEDTFYCDECGNRITGDACSVNDGDYTVCERCSDNHYRWCDNCETLHHNDHECFHAPETRDHSSRPRVGAPTNRFGTRTVGIEIETGSGATCSCFADNFSSNYRHWGYKEDGSLSEGGMELVSPPLGGDTIRTELEGVYKTLKRFDVDMHDDEAGCHIHVDYKDIRTKLVAADLKSDDVPGDLFVEWGNAITEITRLMVSYDRAFNNTYCHGAFGMRWHGEVHPTVQKKVSETGYAAVAVRQSTIEFRIWEVTHDARVTTARAEFSQKAVDYLSKMMYAPSAKLLKQFHKRFRKAYNNFMVGYYKPLVRLLKLSKECLEVLLPTIERRVSERFSDGPRRFRHVYAEF